MYVNKIYLIDILGILKLLIKLINKQLFQAAAALSNGRE